MRQSNFALRLQPSLMEAARKIANSEGVALNQLINVAVAQLVASHESFDYIAMRAKRANVERALEILRKPRTGEPPREGDELPEGWAERRATSKKKAS
jgi:hypothetical protein